ncbi:DUF4936 family protein [Oxalobacteraceae bacterium OM1]|nr:DUF4936 family protein [Oxalobacteraceae bacterium OM1]
MTDFYVYYRVPVEHAAALRLRVEAMQRRLAMECAIVGRLKRRPEEKDGRQTWMEVYAGAPDDFAATLERVAHDADVSSLIDGGRHTETFVDFPECA